MAGSKAELRRELLALRRSLSERDRESASARAVRALADSFYLEDAKTIALYAPLWDEADPLALETVARGLGIPVVYPRVEGAHLVFAQATAALLAPRGQFRIREPPEDAPQVSIDAIDLFIVPGVGFSRQGHRLGFGRGFYDRVLGKARSGSTAIRAVGFAFACQVQDAIPWTEGDEPVDAIATEDGLIVIA